MDYFLTSFFRIRVVALILKFFLLCFFVGLLKGAFADWPGECTFVLEVKPQIKKTYFTPVLKFEYEISSTGTFVSVGFQNVTEYYGDGDIQTYFYENGKWIHRVRFTGDSINKIAVDGTILPDQCGEPCQEEKNRAIQDCGGESNVDWDTWNESTCEGKCKLSINANLGSPKPDQCP